MKRTNVLGWDEYFMGLAHLSAMRSKDPNTQVGAVIVDQKNRVVSIGYNGFPRGCSDDTFSWNKSQEDFLDNKEAYVVHAELNAILNAPSSVNGCRIFVSLFPCNECAKAIIQSGIVEVIYECDKYRDTQSVIASKKMMDAANVKYTQLPNRLLVEVSKEINNSQ